MKKITKQETSLIIRIVLAICIMGLILFGGLNIMNKEFDKQIISGCELGKTKTIISIYSDLNDFSDSFYLCSDKECEDYFENKINKTGERLISIRNFDCIQFSKDLK